ncbi:MAG: Lrp/AsnC family transcriptional regulator [Nitrososphaera sp.]
MSASSFQERQNGGEVCAPLQDNNNPEIESLSRRGLLQAMEKLGINTQSLEPLTLEQLHDLFGRLNKLTSATNDNNSSSQDPKDSSRYNNHHYPHRLQMDGAGSSAVLSPIDKQMLKLLLASNGDVSSMTLSKELGVPLTTIQRRRKRLAGFMDVSCSLALKKFDLRSITFFIAAENGMSTSVAKEILAWPSVMSVARTLSNNNIDIKADVVLKTNKEIIDFSEKVKMLPGVREVFWTESIELMGKNSDMLYSKIDAI